jgi:hypothetical protein
MKIISKLTGDILIFALFLITKILFIWLPIYKRSSSIYTHNMRFYNKLLMLYDNSII